MKKERSCPYPVPLEQQDFRGPPGSKGPKVLSVSFTWRLGVGEMCSRFSHADHWSFSPQVTEVFLEPREGRVSLERRVQSASLGLAFQGLPAPKVTPQDKAALGGLLAQATACVGPDGGARLRLVSTKGSSSREF